MIRLTFFLVAVLGALLFGVSAVVQADQREFTIVIDTPVYVVLYECMENFRYPTTTTMTDGIRTLSIIQGPCYEL